MSGPAHPPRRYLGQWNFEGGGCVQIIVDGQVSTEEALDMVETLILLKRRELNRRATPETPHD